MNIYPFRFLLGKKHWGKSYHLIKKLKKSSCFKWARFDVYMPKKGSDKLVIFLGQIHPVLTGKVYWFTAKNIGKTQSRLYTYYDELYKHFGVGEFGEEGVTCDQQQGFFRYRLHDLKHNLAYEDYSHLEEGKMSFSRIRNILVKLATKWQKVLKRNPQNPQLVQPHASLISGARLFSVKNDKVVFYAVEGERAYSFTLKHITRLQKEIHDLEHDFYFKKARGKKFRNLTQEEYNVAKKYGDKVKTFNNVLKAPIRDEATLKVCLDHIDRSPLVVFTMGIGHRRNYLKLVNGLFKKQGVSFVIITPPEVWFWKFVIQSLKWGSLLFLLIALIFLWVFTK